MSHWLIVCGCEKTAQLKSVIHWGSTNAPGTRILMQTNARTSCSIWVGLHLVLLPSFHTSAHSQVTAINSLFVFIGKGKPRGLSRWAWRRQSPIGSPKRQNLFVRGIHAEDAWKVVITQYVQPRNICSLYSYTRNTLVLSYFFLKDKHL
jgi:hypothetical protein